MHLHWLEKKLPQIVVSAAQHKKANPIDKDGVCREAKSKFARALVAAGGGSVFVALFFGLFFRLLFRLGCWP
jgi:hypothetical protein